jgi:cytoskeleton protein RodZ
MNAALSMNEAPVMDGGASAGTLLRQAREAAGLHVAALAVALKVPVRKIEALEQDRLDELPDAVFARALAASMCRTLKIDPQPILERLPQGNPMRGVPERDPINEPFRAPGDALPATWRNRLTRPVSLAVIALLVGALVLVFMPDLPDRDTVAGNGNPDAALGAPAAGAPAAGTPAQPVVVNEPTLPTGAVAPGGPSSAGDAAQGAASTSATAAAPAPGAANAGPAAAAPGAAAAAPTASAAGAAPEAPTVVFTTTGRSWVEVTDAKGAVALRRMMGPGDTAAVSGVHPLAVTVGSVRDTSVQVRGKPYDLAAVSKDNVARFEVK